MCTRKTAFYPRDVMLARVLVMVLCLCQSVTSRCSIEVVGRIELAVFFDMGLLSTSPTLTLCFKEIQYL